MRSARAGACVASFGLLLTGLGSVTAPADAVPSNNPVGIDTAADWLTAEFGDAGILRTGAGDDYGLTIDAAFGLSALDRVEELTKIATAMSSKVSAYTQYPNQSPAGTTHVSGGGLAKIGVLADLAGDPASYGGHDLVTETAARVATASPIAGRLEDGGIGTGSFDGDYSNVIGQAYAVRLLGLAGNAKAASARDFLLQQQCPDGGFRLYFTTSKTASGQSCTGNTQDDTDATAIVVAQLAELPSSGAVDTALTQARSWLHSVQHVDGSWEGTGETAVSNSDSTGLAAMAQATDLATYGADVTAAATWLRDHQVTYYDVCDRLLRERGAIAYSVSSLSAGRSNGIVATSADPYTRRQWRLATAQAMPALQFLPQDSTPSDPEMTAPAGYQEAGSQISLTIAGVHSGDKLCLNSGTSFLRQFTAAGTIDHELLVLPGRSGHYPYTVRDEYGHPSQVVIGVLAEKTLTVTRTPAKVKRNATITAAVRGLAPHEPARIYYGNTLVKAGPASAAGNFVAYIPSGTALGLQYVKGYGQFGDIRKGYTTVTVVR